MQKKVFKILILIIITALTAVGFAACDNKVTPAFITEVSVSALPKQYYAKGEKFNIEGGALKVVYSDGGSVVIPMSDPEVIISHEGTDVVNGALGYKIADVDYKGFKTGFRFSVDTNPVAEIALSGEPQAIYAVSEIRKEPILKDVKLTVNYQNVGNAPKIINLNDTASSLKTKGVYLENFSVAKTGLYQFEVWYKATVFKIGYEVVGEDWIIEESVFYENSITKNYLIGDEIQLGTAEIKSTYNSLKEEKTKLTLDRIFFLGENNEEEPVSTAAAGKFKFVIKGKEFDFTDSNKYFINVYNPDETANIDKLLLKKAAGSAGSNNEGFLNVNDSKTYAQYLAQTVLGLKMKDGNTVTIYGDTDGVSVHFAVPDPENNNKPSVDADGNLLVGDEFDEAAYAAALTLGQSFDIVFRYKAQAGLACTAGVTVRKYISKTIIENWSTVKLDYTYAEGLTFDFGGATLKYEYDDGTSDEPVSIQAQYALPANERVIQFNNKNAIAVETFNMSVGRHKNQFYIAVQRSLIIDGVETPHDAGRLYLDYTVRAAA